MMAPSDDYKLTDLDYLIGDHHLQMIKAALPYLNVPEQKAVSVFVKCQELRKTMELFETEEIASMGICSLEMIDMAENLMEGQTPMEQLRRFLSPEQQSRLETMQMVMSAIQAMA